MAGESTPSVDVPTESSGAADTDTTSQNGSVDVGDSGVESENAADSEATSHVYRTVRIIAYTDAMMPTLTGLLENTFGFEDWLPRLTFTYDTTTGMAESASFTTYYPQNNMGIEETLEAEKAALTQDTEVCRRFSNIRTEVMEAEELIALSFDIDISTYFNHFEPLLSQCFVEGRQDIGRYKDEVYFKRIDNYLDPKPEYEEGDNFFYEKITWRRIEWED